MEKSYGNEGALKSVLRRDTSFLTPGSSIREEGREVRFASNRLILLDIGYVDENL